jgi:hypothetical protein
MARKTIVEDPTEDLAEELAGSGADIFTIEQLSDIVAHNIERGLLHLPAHVVENKRADNSKE